MTGLKFEVCVACAERHALWRGAMTVHTTAAGGRCSGRVNDPSAAFESKAEQAAKVLSRQVGAVTTAQVRDKSPKTSHEAYARHSGHPLVTLTPIPTPKQRQNPPGSRMLPTTTAESLAKIAKAEKNARDKKRNKLFGMHPRRTEPQDRVVYVTKTTRVVSGGLPSLGRGR